MDKKYILFSIILVIVILTLIVVTFGLFETSTVRRVEATLGNWVVEVNGTDITTNETFDIDNIILNSSTNVAEGKLAPGGSGYFNIVIDPSTSKVSVRYDITYDLSELENYDLTFDIEEVNNRTLIKTDENTYTGVITLSEIVNGATSVVKCSVAWNNDETKNDADSVVGLDKNAEFQIPVQVKATQYLGETISAYVEE